jgi:hypothetical protein
MDCLLYGQPMERRFFLKKYNFASINEVYFSQAFWQHQAWPIPIFYVYVIIVCLKQVKIQFSCNFEELNHMANIIQGLKGKVPKN